MALYDFSSGAILAMEATLAEGRKGDAMALFTMVTGACEDRIKGMHDTPLWQIFEIVAPTLVYDQDLIHKATGGGCGRAGMQN